MRRFVSTLLACAGVTVPWPVYANPYLSKPGEAVATVRAATCAITVSKPCPIDVFSVSDSVQSGRSRKPFVSWKRRFFHSLFGTVPSTDSFGTLSRPEW